MPGVAVDRVSRSALRIAASALFVVYLAWNSYWLSGGELAPSLLVGFFGLPSPTTGCIRSLECMLAGRWTDSILYNPFTLPIGALFVGTVGLLVMRAVRRRRVIMPAGLGWSWLALLTAAWVCKLIGPHEYW